MPIGPSRRRKAEPNGRIRDDDADRPPRLVVDDLSGPATGASIGRSFYEPFLPASKPVGDWSSLSPDAVDVVRKVLLGKRQAASGAHQLHLRTIAEVRGEERALEAGSIHDRPEPS